jgi:quercetin dioxygenase-like cupin family protein
VVLSGELEVTVGNDAPIVLSAGTAVHVPADTVHAYRNVTDCHFLTITTEGNASKFFAEAVNVQMDPPDIPAIIGLGNQHGVSFPL